MAFNIAFFGTQPYDESSFKHKNAEFGFELKFFKGHLNMNNVILTQGVDVVCIFVNDIADAQVIRAMAANGVKLIALRCAGYNNVDLNAAQENGIKVVRVPAYSPYAVAEHTVAYLCSSLDDVEMSSRDRVEGPGVNCCCHRYGLLYLRALEKRIWCCHDSTFQFLLQVPGRIAIAISLIFSQSTSHWGASSWYTLSKPYRQNFIKYFFEKNCFCYTKQSPQIPKKFSQIVLRGIFSRKRA